MRVPGIIVARTDAESATFLDNRTDERDQPFILGATNIDLPSYRVGFLTILKSLHDLGLDEIRGHLLFAVSDAAIPAGGRVARASRAHVAHRAGRPDTATPAGTRPRSTACSTRSRPGTPRSGRRKPA